VLVLLVGTKERLPEFEQIMLGVQGASYEIVQASYGTMPENDKQFLFALTDEIFEGLKWKKYMVRPNVKLATVELVRKTAVNLRLHYTFFEEFKTFSGVSSHTKIAAMVEAFSEKSGLKIKKENDKTFALYA